MDLEAPPDPSGSPVRVRVEKESVDEGSEIGESISLAAKKGCPSYVSVAQDKKVLRKYDVAVLERDGEHSVTIPEDVLTTSTPLWEDFIVGKFLDVSPHVAKVHMVLNKIWKYGEIAAKVEVFEVNATTMRFRVSNPKAREKILKRGMWNIVGVPMVVSKWTPRSEEEKQEEEALPMWVHLRRVPLHMFSWEGLSFISSAVGFPARLHPETIACTNFEEAKVFVNVNISKPLPKAINFTKNGSDFVVDFHYPWLPPRCKTCGKWGHLEEVCGLKGKNTEGKGNLTEKRQVEESIQDTAPIQHQENLGVCVEVEVGGVCVEVEEEGVCVEGGLGIGSAEEGLIQKEQENTSEKNMGALGETDWSLVSPTKVGRSPSRMASENRNEVIITASKFSVLSTDEEEEGEIMEDRVLITDKLGADPMESKEETEMALVAGISNEETVGVVTTVATTPAATTELCETVVYRDDVEPKEGKRKGARRETSTSKENEKKAKPQDVSSTAMSTRSSRRLH